MTIHTVNSFLIGILSQKIIVMFFKLISVIPLLDQMYQLRFMKRCLAPS